MASRFMKKKRAADDRLRRHTKVRHEMNAHRFYQTITCPHDEVQCVQPLDDWMMPYDPIYLWRGADCGLGIASREKETHQITVKGIRRG